MALAMDELTDSEVEALAGHLDGCEDCRSLLESFRQEEQLLHAGLDRMAARANAKIWQSYKSAGEENAAALIERRGTAKRRARVLAIAAAVTLAFAGLFSWLLPGDRTAGLAFADVLEQIRVFRPYSCLYSWEYDGKPPRSYRLMRPSLSRRREVHPDGTILVFDLTEEPNRILRLYPDQNRAEEKTLLGTGPRRDPDVLRTLAAMRDGLAEDLGTKEVEGRLAHGFHAGNAVNDYTIWADPGTGLPVRIELRHVKHGRTLVMSEFEFDVDFDESLFSTTAPEGYTVEREEIAVKTVGISADEIVERAGFQVYVLAADPPWARAVQIVEATDPTSPARRMYLFAAPAEDGRHFVLAQSQTYNRMLPSKVRQGCLIYTSPNGFKVWAGGPEHWYSKVLLDSARSIIQDDPSEHRVAYALESPEGTFPILAVNGPITDEELRSLADSLVPAEGRTRE